MLADCLTGGFTDWQRGWLTVHKGILAGPAAYLAGWLADKIASQFIAGCVTVGFCVMPSWIYLFTFPFKTAEHIVMIGFRQATANCK